jgi:hypothetical protein
MSRRNIDLQSVCPVDLQPAEPGPVRVNGLNKSGVQLRWAHRPQAYVP